MGIDQYISLQLLKKNRGTYFRRGKWIFHVLFVLLFFVIAFSDHLGTMSHWTTAGIIASTCVTLLFFIFFYIYCLYLVPVYFKQNRYRKFWELLILLLAVCPLISYGVTQWARPYLPELNHKLAGHSQGYAIGSAYLRFITTFIGFTSLLYFMELLESISIRKQTAKDQSQIAATELQLIKTRMNPDFMIRSLEGIINLAEHRDEKTPASVVDFSDVLRYRLYRSQQKILPLTEELIQLNNLFRLHNVLPEQEASCTLEAEGDSGGKFIIPLSLINIAESLLTTYTPNTHWSMLMYLLIEEKEIQVAIELTTVEEAAIEEQAKRIRKDLQRLLGPNLNFTVEKEDNIYSLRTCIPMIKSSTVL